MNHVLETLKTWWPQFTAVAGILGAVLGAVGTIWYRRTSVRQRQQLIELGAERRARRVDLTHASFQEWRACKPPLLRSRIVIRNYSDRQEIVCAVFLENAEDSTSQVYFEGRHVLDPHCVLELSAERPMPTKLPSRFLIQLVDGNVSGDLKDESTSHGIFPTYAPEQMAALATGDFDNPAHPFKSQSSRHGSASEHSVSNDFT